jgi:hypothetical protein
LEPSDYENVSAVDKLAIKMFQERQAFMDRVEAEKVEAAAVQQRKKDMSNFLVPPPPGLGSHNVLSSLSSTTAITSIISPHPTLSKRVHNNQQDALDASFNVDEAEEKENSSAIRAIKKKKQPVLAGVDAGTLLYSAMGQKDPTVDMFSSYWLNFRGRRLQLRSVGRKTKLQLSFVVGKQKLMQSSFERKKLNVGLRPRSVLSTLNSSRCFTTGRSR